MTGTVEDYVAASTRENTRRSYASALRHFEQEWGGMLPATAGSVARYLADHAGKLSVGSLRLRLAGLSDWHRSQGFADPTKDPIVRKTLKGIHELHPSVPKQARPLQIQQIETVDADLQTTIREAVRTGDIPARLRATRDRALILLGFWRGFRGDELSRLLVENVVVTAGEGMVCRLTRSKTSQLLEDLEFSTPALSRLCPVAAYEEWISVAGLREGHVFRAVNRWGQVSPDGLHIDSLIPLLRDILGRAGVASASLYSGHSMRRGFAGWASDSGWDVKSLMSYVGWRDMKSALRYVDASPARMRAMIERGLQATPITVVATPAPALPAPTVAAVGGVRRVLLRMNLLSASGQRRGSSSTRRLIEGMFLEPLQMKRLDKEGKRFELHIESSGEESFEDRIQRLLDDLHKTAEDGRCMLEATVHDTDADQYWS